MYVFQWTFIYQCVYVHMYVYVILYICLLFNMSTNGDQVFLDHFLILFYFIYRFKFSIVCYLEAFSPLSASSLDMKFRRSY